MIIAGSRIRSVSRRLGAIPVGKTIIIGLTDLGRFAAQLSHFGLFDNPGDGDTILPPASFGPVASFNAEGRDIVHRDQPMETAYRQTEWRWTEWRGRYDSVERSRIVDVPYKRYPRSFDPPPSVEMTMTTNEDGSGLLVTGEIALIPANHLLILHTVNLFLEIFGECNVMDHNLESIHRVRIRRVNWRVLPQGRMPWAELHKELRPVIQREPQGNQPVIQHRLHAVNAHNPDFVAVGLGGFDGYVIFAFPDRHMYILECVHFGNATYVFGDDWETLSQMTKAEILNYDLQQDRLIHRENWDSSLAGLFRR
ncbi:MAG: hypothetical protein KKA32_10945 [Actinobacteria bacterium]|nr:hypothetical protein [Actinomycetota bacterium]